MLGLKYEDIITKIKEEKGLSDEEIEVKIKEKLNKLSDLISRQGAAHIVANELGVNLFDGSMQFKINRLEAGMRNISVIGKIVKIYGVNQFKNEKREGKVASMLLGDESGVIRLVMWDTKHISKIENGEIKEESVVKVKNSYVKENNGFKELHLSSYGQIENSDEEISVKPISDPNFTKKNIKSLQDGDMNVGVFGTVVQVFEPKFFPICKDCNKKVILDGDKATCEEHGVIKPEYVPVLNFFFDDSTENIRCVAFRDQAMELLGINKEEASGLKENPSNFEEIKNKVLGKQVMVIGRVVKNTMFDRIEMIANRVKDVKPEELIEELER